MKFLNYLVDQKPSHFIEGITRNLNHENQCEEYETKLKYSSKDTNSLQNQIFDHQKKNLEHIKSVIIILLNINFI